MNEGIRAHTHTYTRAHTHTHTHTHTQTNCKRVHAPRPASGLGISMVGSLHMITCLVICLPDTWQGLFSSVLLKVVLLHVAFCIPAFCGSGDAVLGALSGFMRTTCKAESQQPKSVLVIEAATYHTKLHDELSTSENQVGCHRVFHSVPEYHHPHKHYLFNSMNI